MDFKKLKKSSSKKLIQGGLGFFLSPKEEKKSSLDNPNPSKDTTLMFSKKHNDWNSEDLRLENSKDIEEQGKDYTDDIPIIPSLDDFIGDDITSQIAKAPLIGVKQVATINELESDILKHSAFSNLEELNLKVLIKSLHSESSEESDVPWSREMLFNEIVSHINEKKLKS